MHSCRLAKFILPLTFNQSERCLNLKSQLIKLLNDTTHLINIQSIEMFKNHNKIKSLNLLVLFIFNSLCLNAKCSLEGIYIWPTGNRISLNQTFIIEGYAKSQNVIIGLNSKYKIYLKSDFNIVKLRVDTIYKGVYKLTQAILTPQIALTPNLSYKLVIENISDTDVLQKGHENQLPDKYLTWVALDDLHYRSPKWKSTPEIIKKTFEELGCGTENLVFFKCLLESESVYYIKANVRSQLSGIIRSFCLFPMNEIIELGHDMCSGAFEFTSKNIYEVDFTIVDLIGQQSKLEQTIIFTGP